MNGGPGEAGNSIDRPSPQPYHGNETALDGELAVPYARNPL